MTDQEAREWLESLYGSGVREVEVVDGVLSCVIAELSSNWDVSDEKPLEERLTIISVSGLGYGCESCGYGSSVAITGAVRT